MLFVRLLVWDSWNVAHIARHDVIPEEVEEVCHGEPVTSGTDKGRLRVVGATRNGRMLTVILAPAYRTASIILSPPGPPIAKSAATIPNR